MKSELLRKNPIPTEDLGKHAKAELLDWDARIEAPPHDPIGR